MRGSRFLEKVWESETLEDWQDVLTCELRCTTVQELGWVFYYIESQISAGFCRDPSNLGAGISHVQRPIAQQG